MLDVINKLLDLLLAVIPKSKNTLPSALKSPQTSDQDAIKVIPQPVKENAMIIDLNSYFSDPKTGDDRRLKYPNDYTDEILENAKITLKKVNSLLKDLGITNAVVSSGWRPPSVNSAIGGAKKSLHTQGKAIDLKDIIGELDKVISEKPELLAKHALWLEDPSATKGWCHLDWGTRSDRPIRIFKP